MSSHHIVRDEQEPAIIITEVKKEYWQVIRQLLGWVPTVIVAEDCVSDVLLTGIKIDIVICKEENLPSLKKNLQDQQPIKFIIEKEEGIQSAAISYLIGKGYKGVNIFGGFDPQESLSINHQITAIWYDHKYRYVLSHQHAFQKWMVTNHSFCIAPIEEDQVFEVVNADKLPQLKTYSCIHDGKMTIHSQKDFWVGEPLELLNNE